MKLKVYLLKVVSMLKRFLHLNGMQKSMVILTHGY